MSPELSQALRAFEPFLRSDDMERSTLIEASDSHALRSLTETVNPLLAEINAALDGLVAKPHPLPDDEESLEADLNSLAQAGIEARMELDNRS